MIQKIEKVDRIEGELKLPGDKSISHRAVMFGSLAKGKSTVENFLQSDDIFSSINCFRAMGCNIEVLGSKLNIEGAGFGGFKQPNAELDCGNSGTTARLITGILAAQKFNTTLVGDQSLMKRPMSRIVDPLREMGAVIETSENKTLPLRISASENLKAIEYELPVASAQVKSAVLLAGLYLDDETTVIEPVATRNHTETMLGLPVELINGKRVIKSSRANYPNANNYIVPSDISTASFFIILTLLSKDSELILKKVLLNETRTGLLTVLKMMGANIDIVNEIEVGGEIMGDLLIRSSNLVNIMIPDELIPNIIDEIPVLSVAGCFAEGDFKISNAGELRVKESDRISALCNNYKSIGYDIIENDDGFVIKDKQPKNSEALIESYGDHRIAMAFAIYGMTGGCELSIKDFECVAVSNPKFLEQVRSIAK